MKIKTKLFLLLLMLFFILGIGIIVPGYLKLREFEIGEAKDYSTVSIDQLRQEIARSYQTLDVSGLLEIGSYADQSKQSLINRQRNSEPDKRINRFIMNSSGKVLLQKIDQQPLLLSAEIIARFDQQPAGYILHTDNGTKWHLGFSRQNQWDWWLITAMTDKEVYRESVSYLKFVLPIGALALLFVLFLFILLTRDVRERLMLTAGYLRDFKNGEYGKRIVIARKDEVGMLQIDINSMIGSIESNAAIRKKAELALELAKTDAEKANLAKSEFLANMSHEIRNPLNAIVGFTDFLSQTRLDEKQSDFVEKIVHASNVLRSTLTDILDFTKIEQRVIEINNNNFNLHDEVISNFDLFAKGGLDKGLAMTCKIKDDVPLQVCGDKVLYGQIINNLIGNAIKFTSEGEVRLTLSLHQKFAHSYLIELEVSDTGLGIEEEQQHRIFDVFAQADSEPKSRNDGVGLGLAIVNRLVHAIGGSIQLESSPENGSTFSVLLPFDKVRKPREQDPGVSDSTGIAHIGIKVLVVEDEQLNRDYVCEVLRQNRVDYVCAENGLEAIEHLKSQSFDIVLMDMRMPLMSGDEAILYIRRQLPNPLNQIPIVVLTANAFKDDIHKYMIIGATSFLAKPFDANSLMNSIRKFASKGLVPESLDQDSDFDPDSSIDTDSQFSTNA